MKAAITRSLAIAALVLVTAGQAAAVCGDVTGDTKVTSSDALRVLRKSVGQDVAMTCAPEPVEFLNILGMANPLVCNDKGFTAEMTWSRHPDLKWTDFSQDTFPVDVTNYQRVDDSELSGQITMKFGACGTLVFDIDDWGVFYPMPAEGGAWVLPYYDDVEQSVFLLFELTPFDVAALLYGQQSPAGTVIASAPALPGLANGAGR